MKSPAGAANSIARSANREHATKESESKMNGKRTGFTLVELIVVIMIVGILSGSVMLLAGNTDDRDEATRTIANLRQLKSAALMYYADNHMHTGDTTLPAGNQIANLDLYMTRTLDGSYWFGVISDDWYVYRDLAGLGSGVRTRLADLSARDEEKELEGGNDSGVVLRVPFNTGHSQLRLFVLEGGAGSIGGGGGSGGDDDDDGDNVPPGAIQWRDGVLYPRGSLVWREIGGVKRFFVHVIPFVAGNPQGNPPRTTAPEEDILTKGHGQQWSGQWIEWREPVPWTQQGGSDPGDLVSYGETGDIYIAWHQGNQNPAGSNGHGAWQKVSNGWNNNSVYHGGVEVFHKGALFTARNYINPGAGEPGKDGPAWNAWQEQTNQWREYNVYHRESTDPKVLLWHSGIFPDEVWHENKLYRARYSSGPSSTNPASAWQESQWGPWTLISE